MIPADAPAGAPACATGAIGRGGGALYTGRGPVCGTIIRGAGGCGGPRTAGATGRGGACGVADAVMEGTAGADGATTAAGGIAARGGATGLAIGLALVTAAGLAGAAGLSTGATAAGRIAGGGTAAAGAAGGGVGRASGGAATGFATTAGGTPGRAGGATASFFWMMALRTSPGREMFDKSILVLISSSPRKGRADRADGVCASDEPRMCALTFSASCSSIELECVFFSVTPTLVSASRIALLLTSSSLARSLIRTLLIRPFLYSALR
jgi:hypothetical protein